MLFNTPKGREIYNSALSLIESHSMENDIKRGVLVGLSGGADSVMLLHFLLRYRQTVGNFQILAVHINHGIRGEEAERDETFSRELCQAYGVEFSAIRLDIPAIAKIEKLGIEEAARNARYAEFDNIIQSRNDISTIAVAHNATDNLETVMLNMLRGAALSGASGIPPRRDNIIRPLLLSSKKDILSALDGANIPYVTDSTNLSSDYSRNYVRNEILPRLERLSGDPEKMVSRLSKSLRIDEDFLKSEAERFIRYNLVGDMISNKELLRLHQAVFSRVIMALSKKAGASPEQVHIEKARELILRGGSFSLDVPGGASFISDGSYFSVKKTDSLETVSDFEVELKLGENPLFFGKSALFISENKNAIFSSNVYKISIQECFKFDIINRRLVARSKRDGDSYVVRGATKSLKKLYCDRKISAKQRSRLPVIVSGGDIVWIPGFGVSDEYRPKKDERRIYITYLVADEQP